MCACPRGRQQGPAFLCTHHSVPSHLWYYSQAPLRNLPSVSPECPWRRESRTAEARLVLFSPQGFSVSPFITFFKFKSERYLKGECFHYEIIWFPKKQKRSLSKLVSFRVSMLWIRVVIWRSYCSFLPQWSRRPGCPVAPLPGLAAYGWSATSQDSTQNMCGSRGWGVRRRSLALSKGTSCPTQTGRGISG